MRPLPAKLQRLVRDRAAIGGSGRKHPGIRLHPGGVTSAFPSTRMHALDSGSRKDRLTSVQRGISMQVSVESTSALERRMTVGVPAERIETEVNKRLQQTARRAKIPGFRPGKVPMSVIRQRYEASARQEAMGDLIQETFYEAVVEQKLNPAGSPSVEPKSFERQGPGIHRNLRSLPGIYRFRPGRHQGRAPAGRSFRC